MLDWLNEIAGPGYAQAVLWTGLALLVLVVVLIVIRLVRSMTFGTFVAGGRNRKARLAVMDAAALDSHRRLVLVRRDDVEHLLLIGGPSDLVVERDIRLGAAQRRQPAATDGDMPLPQPPAPPNLPVQRPRAPEPARTVPQPQQPAARPPVDRAPPEPPRAVEAPRRVEAVAPARPAQRPEQTRAPLSPMPRMETRNTDAVVARPPAQSLGQAARPGNQTVSADHLDDDLLKELEVSLDNSKSKPPSRSLDDEMSKLLGELSNPRR